MLCLTAHKKEGMKAVSSIILYIKIILSNKEFQESLICGNFKIKSAFNALFISKILDNWEEREEESGDEI